jgi:hypothetical protein
VTTWVMLSAFSRIVASSEEIEPADSTGCRMVRPMPPSRSRPASASCRRTSPPPWPAARPWWTGPPQPPGVTRPRGPYFLAMHSS